MFVKKLSIKLLAMIAVLAIGFFVSGSFGDEDCYCPETCSASPVACYHTTVPTDMCIAVQVFSDQIGEANPTGAYEASDLKCAGRMKGIWNGISCDSCSEFVAGMGGIAAATSYGNCPSE